MKVYKVELMIIDFDGMGENNIKDVLENTKYPNYCINPQVMDMKENEVDWSDEHPLNKTDTQKTFFEELFN